MSLRPASMLVLLGTIGGCGRDRGVSDPVITRSRIAVGAIAKVSTAPLIPSVAVSMPAPQAPVTAPAPTFALVGAGPVKLHRLLTGPVIATTGSQNLFFALGSDGQVTRLDSVEAAIRSTAGDVGAVGGSWPGTLFIERYGIKFSTIGLVVKGDQSNARVVRTLRGEYVLPASWRDGATLTARVEGCSEAFGSPPLDRAVRLETMDGIAAPIPAFPKNALFDDAFVAYPSGRMFALGGQRTRPVVEDDASEYEQQKGYMIDGALVWQTDATGRGMEAVQLPGTKPRDRLLHGRLLAGAVDTEALVWGQLEIWKDRKSETKPYLARFGASGWTQLPLDRGLLELSRGSDGTLWAIVTSSSFDPFARTWLERVTATADGGLHFVQRAEIVARPEWPKLAESAGWWWSCESLNPREISVVTANDIWLTADCAESDGGALGWLLHTNLQAPLVNLTERAVSVPNAKLRRLNNAH